MPCPEIAYMTKAMTRSRQPRPQPQATGAAATTARNGTTMNSASAICSKRARRNVPGTDAIGPVSAPLTAGAGAGRVAVVVGAVMQLLLSCRVCSPGPLSTYGSVTYATVGLARGLPGARSVDRRGLWKV